MEILSSQIMKEMSLWSALSFSGTLIALVMAIILLKEEYTFLGTMFLAISIVCFIILISIPIYKETGEISYTIEITDSSSYKTLIDKGFRFEKLFENKDIYTIIGKGELM